MSNERFEFGDRVRHTARPEWGVGSVVKTEDLPVKNGTSAQRVSVRFSGAGIKVMSTAHATLERVVEEAVGEQGGDDPGSLRIWDEIEEADWLAPLVRRKIDEAMSSLPSEATDPFRALRDRIAFTLGLYRFDRTSRPLIDWAVAQTGLTDPLSRFSRHELEQYFDRWAFVRDAHLGRLLQEAGGGQFQIEELLAKAPPTAVAAVRRLASVR